MLKIKLMEKSNDKIIKLYNLFKKIIKIIDKNAKEKLFIEV